MVPLPITCVITATTTFLRMSGDGIYIFIAWDLCYFLGWGAHGVKPSQVPRSWGLVLV